MKTMTRPAAGADRPAAAGDLFAAGRTRFANRLGRSSQVSRWWWGLAAGSAGVIAVIDPLLLPWLLLPVAPAILVWAAGCEGGLGCGRRVMRLFAAATLAAVLFQLAGLGPNAVEVVAAAVATVGFVIAVERLATGGGKAAAPTKPLGRPAA